MLLGETTGYLEPKQGSKRMILTRIMLRFAQPTGRNSDHATNHNPNSYV